MGLATLIVAVALAPGFHSSVQPIPSQMRAQMTGVSWHAGCPVGLGELRLITLTYRGFDGRDHTGRLIANRSAGSQLVGVFRRLYAARFPIRRMEPVDRYGGDDYRSIEADNTSAFNCRAATGSSRWSNHAYGLAIDVNPIENPYISSGTHPTRRASPISTAPVDVPAWHTRAACSSRHFGGSAGGGAGAGRAPSRTHSTSPTTAAKLAPVLRGALAASVTPLRDGGAAIDEDGFGRVADFLHTGGLDGLLALGTNGEGILLSIPERKRAVELFLEASAGRLQVAVHAGAQSTADTVALGAHAAEAGADAVAVIAPPYFALDETSQLEHFAAAAAACAPLPFYVYEFAITSGYPVAPAVVERLRERAPNLAGMKVSDRTWEQLEGYLIEGLDVFIGYEAFIGRAREVGAAGAVSALASAFPEIVAAAVRGEDVDPGALRAEIDRFPRHAALKHVLVRRGVPIREDVRAPLRGLTDDECVELDRLLDTVLQPA